MSSQPDPAAADRARFSRAIGRLTRMASSARSSLTPRRAELAALHAEISRAGDEPDHAAVVIDQAVDLRRELQSDHAEACSILRALHSVAEGGGPEAAALTDATTSAATLVTATNAACHSLSPLSRCLVDELEVSAARAMTTIAERFTDTAILTSIQLDHALVEALHRRKRGRPVRRLEA